MTALGCAAKVIFSPVILVSQAIWIYFFGCLGVYVDRAARGLFCGLCSHCCHWTYRDKKFPATSVSIGTWKGKNKQQLDQEVEWKRIKQICGHSELHQAKLFSGGINCHDICQGQLGDCWLMSACACLASQDGAIQKCFITQEYNEYGRYKVRLYDGRRRRWQTITIDDWIPCNKKTGKPLFAKPNGDEAWVLLLEKAMAKFKGSFAALDGGSTMWALEALTGDGVTKFKWETGKQMPAGWQRFDMVHPKTAEETIMIASTNDILSSEEMFDTLVFYLKKRSVIAASSGNGVDTQHVRGIVQGHAYAVVSAKEVEGFKLVRLHNPWGTFEWEGVWGDKSSMWKQHPKVAKALDFKAADDGAFWMSWDDFTQHFKNMEFCLRTTGWDDLRIEINEQHPCCGPVVGCLTGCAKFWCCCAGCRALCCAREVHTFERAPKGACAGCISAC